jgi:hypothetical protein
MKSLLVLFRTRLEWCNFTCGYCPWNANAVRVETEAFQADARRLQRIVQRVAELPRPVEFFITPKAEYMVLPYWREAVRQLLAMPQVTRVTLQTHLGWDVEGYLPTVEASKLALWTTYHPSETDATDRAVLKRRWMLLHEKKVRFTVGMVGTHEHLLELTQLRAFLPPDVYLWVNAYKREPDYYTPAQLQAIRSVDPYFDLNNQHYPSRGQLCTAGSHALYLDDEGDLRRCFFVGDILGNLFRDGWRTLPAPTACPIPTCHCYVGHMHIVDLGFRDLYGDDLAVRRPRHWPLPLVVTAAQGNAASSE